MDRYKTVLVLAAAVGVGVALRITLPYSAAFGKNWDIMNNSQRAELFVSWFLVLLFTGGVLLTIKGKWDISNITIMAGIWLSLALCVAVPFISMLYGSGRVYYVAIIIIAPAMAYTLSLLPYKYTGYIVGYSAIVLYGLLTANVV